MDGLFGNRKVEEEDLVARKKDTPNVERNARREKRGVRAEHDITIEQWAHLYHKKKGKPQELGPLNGLWQIPFVDEEQFTTYPGLICAVETSRGDCAFNSLVVLGLRDPIGAKRGSAEVARVESIAASAGGLPNDELARFITTTNAREMVKQSKKLSPSEFMNYLSQNLKEGHGTYVSYSFPTGSHAVVAYKTEDGIVKLFDPQNHEDGTATTMDHFIELQNATEAAEQGELRFYVFIYPSIQDVNMIGWITSFFSKPAPIERQSTARAGKSLHDHQKISLKRAIMRENCPAGAKEELLGLVSEMIEALVQGGMIDALEDDLKDYYTRIFDICDNEGVDKAKEEIERILKAKMEGGANKRRKQKTVSKKCKKGKAKTTTKNNNKKIKRTIVV
uniref:Uncharacterized protein n=1 Tax=viral metagenome TaxID=1070528 RepID=A0A6C0I3W1_9ZZZZ